PRDEQGRFASKPKEEENPQQEQPTTEDKPTEQSKDAKTPEDEAAKQAQEDAELLEGVKSERGRERVQKLISERNEVKAKAEELDRSMTEVREVLASAGMDAQQFAQHIEFSRLVNSNNPQDLGVAAQMIEQVRADIYKRLGQDAPGVDVLSDFPDLAQRVNSFELDRNAALEIARYRRQQQQAEQTQRQQMEQQQNSQRETQALQGAMQEVESYLSTRSREADHQARMDVLGKYFKDQNNIQEFVQTYRPDQMAKAIRWMYDNIQVAPSNPSPSPIRSKPSSLGQPAANPNAAPIEKISGFIDQMGI
ncbi:MAG TPA: hypothetical protein DIU11_17360, partial [Pusillimonas sp.]|nr:hypothetical protein [Pusillimonas sp.]